MEMKFNKLKILLFTTILLIFTNLVIIYNVPFLRQFMALIYFLIIPGLLIFIILSEKINLKNILISVGLSIAIMIILGISLNTLYPFIIKPLSLFPILISYNLIIIILSAILYKTNISNHIWKIKLKF